MSFLTFHYVGESNSGKTKRWEVFSASTSSLGRISWYSSWRRYAFSPTFLTIFDENCLREIADFLKKVTMEHKEEKND